MLGPQGYTWEYYIGEKCVSVMKLCMSKSWRRTNVYTIAVKYRYNDIQDYVEMLEEPKVLEDP